MRGVVLIVCAPSSAGWLSSTSASELGVVDVLEEAVALSYSEAAVVPRVRLPVHVGLEIIPLQKRGRGRGREGEICVKRERLP